MLAANATTHANTVAVKPPSNTNYKLQLTPNHLTYSIVV